MRYEDRYGLEGYVENGAFRQFPPYTAMPYYETNFPRFPATLPPEEQAAMRSYQDEILEAIAKEPTTNLAANHTKEILEGWGGWTSAQTAELLEKARGTQSKTE